MSGYFVNRIGINHLGNAGRHFSVGRAVDSAWQWRSKWTNVCFNHSGAEQIQAQTGIEVSIRPIHPDETLHLTYKPDQFARYINDNINPVLWTYVSNEAGDNDAVFDFLSGVIEETEATNRKLIVWSGNIGQPVDTNRWKAAKAQRLLQLCHENRDRVIFAVHEGFAAVWLSGVIGGPPIELRRDDGSLIHPDYTDRKNWLPSVWKPHDLTCFHSGRFKFLNRACLEHTSTKYPNGYAPPRLLITEWASGFLRDIESWLNTLPWSLDSWRDHAPYWREKYPEWSAARTYAEMMIACNEAMYKNTNVEGVLFYCGGHYDHEGSANWKKHDVYNVEGDGFDTIDLHTRIAEYAATLDTQQPPTPPAPPTPPPAPTPEPTPQPPADTVTLTTAQWQLLKQRLNEAQDGIELARDVTREVDAANESE